MLAVDPSGLWPCWNMGIFGCHGDCANRPDCNPKPPKPPAIPPDDGLKRGNPGPMCPGPQNFGNGGTPPPPPKPPGWLPPPPRKNPGRPEGGWTPYIPPVSGLPPRLDGACWGVINGVAYCLVPDPGGLIGLLDPGAAGDLFCIRMLKYLQQAYQSCIAQGDSIWCDDILARLEQWAAFCAHRNKKD